MLKADDVVAMVDWEPVVAAIRSSPIYHWDYEDAAKCVLGYVERYMAGDLRTWRTVRVETHWALRVQVAGDGAVSYFIAQDDPNATEVVNGPDKANVVHGYTDLIGYRADGGTDVVDWKTASELDASWESRLRDSWQWRLYCAVHGAASFYYRGIDKTGLAPKVPGKPYDWGRVGQRSLVLTPSETNVSEVLGWLRGASAMRDSLVNLAPIGHWPRRMPEACRPWNRPCPFTANCRGESAGVHDPFVTKAFSYSGITTFLGCPEYYRLATVTGEKGATSAADLGSAVHRGMAAVYGQFDRLREALA